MRNSEYWEQRALDMLKERLESEKEPIENIKKMFEAASMELSAEIFKWFVRFAKNNNVPLSQAKKLLNSDELEEFKKDVFDYIEMGRNNENGEFSKELENMSARVHISRYEAIMFQVNKIAAETAGAEEKTLERYLSDTYQETYMRSVYEFEKGTGIGVDFSRIDENEVKILLDKPWAADGRHFSERIWGDQRKELVRSLDSELRKMLVTGGNPLDLAPKIEKKFDVTRYQAERLLRTESAYFAEEATYNSYKECGCEEYEIIATLDYKTSEICQEMDGKHFKVAEKKTGVNYPPFHPNCRTTTAPYIDDPELRKSDTRIARDIEGKSYYVPGDMTYKEWYESLDSEERAEFVKQSKMDKNRKSDKEQYDRYKKILGKETVPKTFDKWQELKYNADKTEYEDLKKSYKEKRNSLQERLDYVWNGEKNFIPTGVVMSYAKTIAGAGSKTELRVEKYLINQYGGSAGEWQKRVGKIESAKYVFDVHWYELDYKQYDAKVKYRGDKF